MSVPANMPDRSHQASDQLRREREARGECIKCGKPSDGRQRCTECSQLVEANTERFRKGKRGPNSKISMDLVDLQFALDSLTKAHRGLSLEEEIARSGHRELPSDRERRRDELLSQVELARRFCVEVLARHDWKPAELARATRRIRAVR